jgi:uncharacterized protein
MSDSASHQHLAIDYVELAAVDLGAAKRFYEAAARGRIVADIFSFPGGRRFQFADPSGNELGVWSDR